MRPYGIWFELMVISTLWMLFGVDYDTPKIVFFIVFPALLALMLGGRYLLGAMSPSPNSYRFRFLGMNLGNALLLSSIFVPALIWGADVTGKIMGAAVLTIIGYTAFHLFWDRWLFNKAKKRLRGGLSSTIEIYDKATVQDSDGKLFRGWLLLTKNDLVFCSLSGKKIFSKIGISAAEQDIDIALFKLFRCPLGFRLPHRKLRFYVNFPKLWLDRIGR